MKKEDKRIAIYPKDIKEITGKSLRWSQQKLKEIRNCLNKKDKQIVTFVEFYKFMGVG